MFFSLDYAIIEGVFLCVVSPVGRGHTAIWVQKDSETPYNEKGQENEE